MGPTAPRRNMMAKYLLLKHYRGAPAPVNDVPMEQWTPCPPETHAGSSGTAATARWANRYDECSSNPAPPRDGREAWCVRRGSACVRAGGFSFGGVGAPG